MLILEVKKGKIAQFISKNTLLWNIKYTNIEMKFK